MSEDRTWYEYKQTNCQKIWKALAWITVKCYQKKKHHPHLLSWFCIECLYRNGWNFKTTSQMTVLLAAAMHILGVFQCNTTHTSIMPQNKWSEFCEQCDEDPQSLVSTVRRWPHESDGASDRRPHFQCGRTAHSNELYTLVVYKHNTIIKCDRKILFCAFVIKNMTKCIMPLYLAFWISWFGFAIARTFSSAPDLFCAWSLSLHSNMSTDKNRQIFNTNLIAEVRKHDISWKGTDKKYKAMSSKEPMWHRIAERLGSTDVQEIIVNKGEIGEKKKNNVFKPKWISLLYVQL